MRCATILPRGAREAVPVVAGPDGAWIELAAAMGRDCGRLEEALPWWLQHGAALAKRTAEWAGPRYRESEFVFMPPVRPPSFRDFYAFEQHVKTARARRGLAMVPAWYEIPVFYFSNHHALIGHEAPVSAPRGSQELDYELELGVVLGRGGRDIEPENAWAHVAGFTIINDWSARDLQRAEMAVGLGPAKGKDFATSVGPWLVSRDAVADRIEGERLTLDMTARVNGRTLSRGNVAALHHSIPRLIAHASRDVDLLPGDLLGTGTVGTGCILELGPENTGGWLKPGDVVELEIERIGVLRTPVAARE
ncbi:fumarylacetoacetate hydrolase family protein [Horticoccus luteus]|uniref:Fumarylacetoacetate hydrolase family protein n=1 Tax=Horticoccus luteus TaxID=2862869 RepID=A0A8F9XGZ8_9BACT|nr:fumarylacetoacetate hydrolase family protein [Horticoccus luteus]QYM78775.1 fumarylacetoacetate hydrolase family protein [Horticoccus luteus]